MKCLITSVILSTFVTLTASSAVASVLFASSNDHIDRNVSEIIYTIDQSNGLATDLGDSGFFGGDLTSDWRPGSFRIWGADYNTNQLITIDPNTGAGTAVGSFGSRREGGAMQSIAFDPLTEKMYGINEGSVFYEIDVATANATPIGSVGFGEVFGFAFDLTGALYATTDTSDELITIDTTTGAGAAVGNTIDGITSIAVRPEDGVMFAIETIGGTVQTLDLTNGDATLVGAYGANVDFMVGLAFSPVPEPSAFVLTVIGLLTALRRQRRLLFPT